MKTLRKVLSVAISFMMVLASASLVLATDEAAPYSLAEPQTGVVAPTDLSLTYVDKGANCNVILSWSGTSEKYDVTYGSSTVTVEAASCTLLLEKGKMIPIRVTPYDGEEPAADDYSANATALTSFVNCNVNGSTAELSWDTLDDVNYVVKNGDNTVVSEEDVVNGSATIAVEAGERYSFYVEAVAESVNVKGPVRVVQVAPENVTGLKSYSSYNAIVLTWDAVSDADGYHVYRSTSSGGSYSLIKTIDGAGTGTIEYKNTGLKKSTSNYYSDKNYYYRVYAFKGEQDSDKPATVNDSIVRQMYIKFTVTRNRKLKAHDGSGKTVTIKKGTVLKSHGFISGRYMFYYKGHLYYINKTSTTNRTAVYEKSYNYSKKEAEYFVNMKGVKSSTSKMLWTSQYCQRTYYFVKSGGKWVCKDSWDSCTGKASAPTPTGSSGNKSIWMKTRSRHGLKYWSCFASYCAYHSKLQSWKLGFPASGGCIRNSTEDANFVYNSVPKNSRVLIF